MFQFIPLMFLKNNLTTGVEFNPSKLDFLRSGKA